MKRHYYLIVDTETTMQNTVADFGAVVVDRHGLVVEQFGVLLDGHFGSIELFHDERAPVESFWSTMALHRRKKHYDELLARGQRCICNPSLVNLWLARVKAQYNPVVTAYNMSFDYGKCAKTGIDLGIFQNRFCLMKAAKSHISTTPDYVDFCCCYGLLTKTGRVSTTAETMARFILGADTDAEPHTALEDARDYETPILAYILRDLSRKKLLAIG